MAEIDDGGPAFARGAPGYSAQVGMTLRDWFAGQALAGICAALGQDMRLEKESQSPAVNNRFVFNVAARDAYRLADSMLAQRKEPSDG